jgi:hypothetical protein
VHQGAVLITQLATHTCTWHQLRLHTTSSTPAFNLSILACCCVALQRAAAVVFDAVDGVSAAMKQGGSGQVVQYELPPPEGPVGLKAWVADHKTARPGNEALQQQVRWCVDEPRRDGEGMLNGPAELGVAQPEDVASNVTGHAHACVCNCVCVHVCPGSAVEQTYADHWCAASHDSTRLTHLWQLMLSIVLTRLILCCACFNHPGNSPPPQLDAWVEGHEAAEAARRAAAQAAMAEDGWTVVTRTKVTHLELGRGS